MDKENEKKYLTREQMLEVEEKAIEALLQMGVKFSVPLKISPVKPPKWIVWWNKHFPFHMKVWRDSRIPKEWDVSTMEMPDVELGNMKTVYMRHFHVKPLYLGTIDYLRKLYIQIEYDEKTIQDEPIQESKRMFRYIPLMAEIAAVAVLNAPSITNPLCNDIKELQKFFLEHLTVQRLQKLSETIQQMMNPAGFISSIRSIRETGTTKPKQEKIPVPTKANLVE